MERHRYEMSPYNHGGFWPQGLLSNFFNDGWFEGFGMNGFKVDVRETDDAYVIDAEMPGVEKEDIDIGVHDRQLTITASVDETNEQKDDDGRYLRRERRSGSFRRSFSLDDIKAEDIRAEMKNGVLTIRCPKKSPGPTRSRRIDIQ